MINKIKFTFKKPGGDRIYYVNKEDVMVVLNRLPEEVYSNTKEIHFNDKGYGVQYRQCPGYINQIRKEISLCALPPRFSFSRFCGRAISPKVFGAVRGKQWSKLAIRRFMLYDVLLHEIGHQQIIKANAKTLRRKYAGETKAQEFADLWRMNLWAKHFDHPDPVHNPPKKEEFLVYENDE